MPRIRSIKPEAFHSESLSQCSVEAERTFWGMSTLADDAGRLRDQPAVINGALWCLRPQHSVENVEDEISQLVTAGVLCRYVADGKHLIHFPTWREHQKINRPSMSHFAPCPTHDRGPDSVSPHGDVTEPSGRPHAGLTQGSWTDLGTGNREQGAGRRAAAPAGAADARDSPPNGNRRETAAERNARLLQRTPDPTKFGEPKP